jgi:hypothetical protein
MTRFSIHEQITRLVCVEGWSAIAWWAGLRFDDLLRAYPPMSQSKWARVELSVNLDASGNPDPYFMALDLETARHPQTLLATHGPRFRTAFRNESAGLHLYNSACSEADADAKDRRQHHRHHLGHG